MKAFPCPGVFIFKHTSPCWSMQVGEIGGRRMVGCWLCGAACCQQLCGRCTCSVALMIRHVYNLFFTSKQRGHWGPMPLKAAATHHHHHRRFFPAVTLLCWSTDAASTPTRGHRCCFLLEGKHRESPAMACLKRTGGRLLPSLS